MSSDDLLTTLSRNPIAKQLGLPTVPKLRRHSPGDPLLAGPVLVTSVGDGRSAAAPSRGTDGGGRRRVARLRDRFTTIAASQARRRSARIRSASYPASAR